MKDEGMKSIAFMAIAIICVCATCLAIIVAAGLSVGLALNWMVPAIDLGVATLCGLVTVAMFAIAARDFARLVKAHVMREVELNEVGDDDDEELLSAAQVESLADQLSEAVLMRIVAKDTWVRPRSKSRR
jgi:hypothetical protein